MADSSTATIASKATGFAVPSSLKSLEKAPYELEPYPYEFDDTNEATRGNSFAALVELLCNSGTTGDNDDDDADEEQEGTSATVSHWFSRERQQALYTLVRKCTSLAPGTRASLVEVLCKNVQQLCRELTNKETVTSSFRDGFAYHVYMLYTCLFAFASAAHGASSTTASSSRSNSTSSDYQNHTGQMLKTLLLATTTMVQQRNVLWQRGVVDDETLINLPARMAYMVLEQCKNITTRKQLGGDVAIQLIATSFLHGQLQTSICAALLDLMHNHEHCAVLVVDICVAAAAAASVADTTGDALASELLREVGRLQGSAATFGGGGSANSKANGVKFVAPFVSELAAVRPALVLRHLTSLLPQLDREPYNMRSAMVQAIGSILLHLAGDDDSANTNRDDDDTSNESKLLDVTKTRESLLQLLFERVYDVSSYTRAVVLKTLLNLVDTTVLTQQHFLPLTTVAMDRLGDKTVVVRKQAMQLLTTLLENNPFVGDLSPAPFRKKLGELYDEVKANMPELVREAHTSALAAAKESGDEKACHELELVALQATIAEVDSWNDGTDELSDQQQLLSTKVQALKFTQLALDFIDLFENAHVALQGMLLSANTSDVTEALRFFVKARHFRLPCAVTGMKKALSLMWSSESSIRDEVLKGFVDVFLAQPGSDGAELLPNHEIAKNLIVLTGHANVSEQASIEEAMVRLVKDEKIPADVFLILWSIAAKGPGDARAASLQLLAMGASADRSIVDSKSRLKLLLEAGLGDFMQDRRDWRLARAAATALQRTERAKVDVNDAKYLVQEQIMDELCAVARGDLCIDEEPEDTMRWFSAAESAIKALFAICPEPEVHCTNIITAMYTITLGHRDTCHSLRLARLFHVVGQVAINLLVYTETLAAGLRRGNAKKSLKAQEAADKAKGKRENKTADDEVDAIESELGVAAEAEAENERKMADITEREILGRGLLSAFGPLITRVVANADGTFSSDILQLASTLSLCKLMCVSSNFCEQNLPVLFTALANAPPGDTILRANTVIALGDLAFRFPNEVEPYTPRLYACLRDPTTKVRRHTLMVLTHLILNDMIKVKGQVCEIAMCLRDDDPRICDMSRLLFSELSKRSNNPVYNLLPDIVSQLSQQELPKEDFRGIMGFLLSYIKKDRQNEMLTDKLCQRFPKCTRIEQKADLAYCLSQLKINERSIKLLSEHFKLYKDALFDDDVRKSFAGIITKAKKLPKPDTKQFLDEWEAKLSESAALGAENEAADNMAAKAKKKAATRTSRPRKQLAAVVEEEEDEEEENEMGDDNLSFDGKEGKVQGSEKENTPVRRANKTAPAKKPKAKSSSKASSATPPRRARRSSRKAVAS